MCIRPIEIINPTRYISASHLADRVVLTVPCGKCAECQGKNALQWSYRIDAEYQDTLESGGYVYYDTLTYAPENRPMISRFFKIVPEHDHSCFDYTDIQKFLKRLRFNLKNSAKNLRYFLVSEYGTTEGRQHAPHYHLLAFVRHSFVNPLEFSKIVSDSWGLGRTDGIAFRSPTYVLNHNVITGRDQSARVVSYVSKYIQKSTSFQGVINSRIMELYESEKIKELPDFHRTNKLIRRRIQRVIGQFHRQSRFFGLSALRDLDLTQVLKDGSMRYQPYGQLAMSVPLSTYYKRHLFQELRVVEGKKIWTYTQDGVRLAEQLQSLGRERLRQELASLSSSNGYHWSSSYMDKLTDYIQNRGRMSTGEHKVATLDERLSHPVLYKYSGDLDAAILGWKFVTDQSCGNDVVGYHCPTSAVKLKDFVHSSRVLLVEELEPLYHEYLAFYNVS